jgi:protease-4
MDQDSQSKRGRGSNAEGSSGAAPLLNTIVRAVATGIFLFSIFLNIVLVVVIIFLGASVAGKEYEGSSGLGYRKTYIGHGGRVERAAGRDELAVIRVEGIILENDVRDGLFGYRESPVNGVRNRLALIREDPDVRGVLLMIESPGGGVTASDVLYQSISSFREETGIPVVALIRQVAASGGYYIASAADQIVAYPTALTGSIGVIVYNFNVNGLMKKYGVDYMAIKSADAKDSLSPFKPVEPGEVEWMQRIVDSMLQRFIDAVDRGRPSLTRDKIEALADGRIYLAADALSLGLIDSIGYMEDAVDELSLLADVSDPVLVEYNRTRGLADLIGMVRAPLPHVSLPVPGRPTGYDGIELYYIWDSALSFRY